MRHDDEDLGSDRGNKGRLVGVLCKDGAKEDGDGGIGLSWVGIATTAAINRCVGDGIGEARVGSEKENQDG